MYAEWASSNVPLAKKDDEDLVIQTVNGGEKGESEPPGAITGGCFKRGRTLDSGSDDKRVKILGKDLRNDLDSDAIPLSLVSGGSM